MSFEGDICYETCCGGTKMLICPECGEQQDGELDLCFDCGVCHIMCCFCNYNDDYVLDLEADECTMD